MANLNLNRNVYQSVLVCFCLGFLLCCISCAENNEHGTQKQVAQKSEIHFEASSSTDTSQCTLPDSLFILDQIQNTSLRHLIYDSYFESHLVINSDSIPLKRLSSDQVEALIFELPEFRSDTNAQEWIRGDWAMFFLARQEKVGQLQPIVLSISGTDYGGLFLLTLNQFCQPISLTELTGGECDGSDHCPIVESRLKGNQIITSEERKLGVISSSERFVDSITYHKVLLPNGSVELIRKDSNRIVKARAAMR